MPNFLHETRKINGKPQDYHDKPKVYFTCHPDDFSQYRDKICSEILHLVDCAFFYTEDVNEPISESEAETHLGEMNLFVVPVTKKLLTTPNRAMEVDIKFAKENNKHILPILADTAIYDDYKKTEKFGTLQYIPYHGIGILSTDKYTEKLEEALKSVLLDPEEIRNIRAAFDAYVFLSYRKKDFNYVNDLRKLIHSVPECRNFAIWYDDYIVAGESFTDSIKRAMEKSKIFALLVTPNVLERIDGKKNYVMSPEYQNAYDTNMEILPVEMQSTDKKVLADEFEGIPKCIRFDDSDGFREAMLETIRRAAITKSSDNPEHDFFIGLAYLEGIDVERNEEFAIELLTSAADGGVEVATKKLAHHFVEFYDPRAVEWCNRLLELYREKYGKTSDEAINTMHLLASALSATTDDESAADVYVQCYEIIRDEFGDKHEKTVIALCECVAYEALIPRYSEQEKLLRKQLAEDRSLMTPKVINSVKEIVSCAEHIGDEGHALEWARFLYDYESEKNGADSAEAIAAHNKVAYYTQRCGRLEETLHERTELYNQKAKIFGENSREAISEMLDIANSYINAAKPSDEKYAAAKEIASELCVRCANLFTTDDKLYASSLRSLARANAKLKHYSEAQKQYEELYAWYENHDPDTETLKNLLREFAEICMNTDKELARDLLIKYCNLLHKLDLDIDTCDPFHIELGAALKMLTEINIEKKNYVAALECQRRFIPIADSWCEPEQVEQAQETIAELEALIKKQG